MLRLIWSRVVYGVRPTLIFDVIYVELSHPTHLSPLRRKYALPDIPWRQIAPSGSSDLLLRCHVLLRPSRTADQ